MDGNGLGEPVFGCWERPLQLTRFSDYAVRLMVLLAPNEGHAITVAAAADHLGISKNHLIKVANLLVRHGYLSAVRGRNGGVQLNRPPSQITIGDILRVTEPGFCLVECMSAPGSCSLERICGVPSYLRHGMAAFLAVMDEARLSDVVSASGGVLGGSAAAAYLQETC